MGSQFPVPGAQTGPIQRAHDDRNALYGLGSSYSKTDAERLFHRLVVDQIIYEELAVTQMEHVVAYIRLGAKSSQLLAGSVKVSVGAYLSKKKVV